MLDEMPARVWDEWQAFDQMQPIGDWRRDLLFARLMALTVELRRDPKKRGEPIQAKEFLVVYDPDEARQASQPKSPDEMLAFVEMVNTALGGRDLRNSPGPTESEEGT